MDAKRFGEAASRVARRVLDALREDAARYDALAAELAAAEPRPEAIAEAADVLRDLAEDCRASLADLTTPRGA